MIKKNKGIFIITEKMEKTSPSIKNCFIIKDKIDNKRYYKLIDKELTPYNKEIFNDNELFTKPTNRTFLGKDIKKFLDVEWITLKKGILKNKIFKGKPL